MNQDRYISWIWQEFADFHNHHCQKYLADNYLYLVKYFAELTQDNLQKTIGTDASIDIIDPLIQAGIGGLLDAIEAFDPVNQMDFEEFCKPFINDAFCDYLKSNTIMARPIRKNIAKDSCKKASSQKTPKYTKGKLWYYAFKEAFSEFFCDVDSEGNVKKPKYIDLESLSEEDLATYMDYYHEVFDYCEKLFYQLTEADMD